MVSIATTTAGSLPRTPALIAANAARPVAADGFTLGTSPEVEALTGKAVADVVERQRQAGITLLGDGEFGKAMSSAVDYGAWWSYSFQRANGLTLSTTDPFTEPAKRSTPGHIVLTSFADRRDWTRFADAYAESIDLGTGATAFPTTTGPLSYRGQEAVAADIRHLKAALRPGEQGFLTAVSPGSAARIGNEYYATEREHLFAWADVLNEEYKAIVDAGLVLQIDDPSLAESWDQINPEPSVADYQEFIQVRVDALNHALEGLPKEQLRLHLCWGSWHGPHTTDIPIADILPVVLGAKVGSLSFEAANARHEHEWTVWREVDIPEELVLVPGVVGHATNVVEHPELVAQRILRYVEAVGPERVIASTDCGLGGRVHRDIAWAKLASLGEGARLAGARLHEH
ncbi:5-methyltetrahydropteroyltriglutamate--homocysteine methyltransferase [Propionibacterium cyclohexanicum]|uniref:5-methyltetrahydropteroyltriglutamate--homocysteine methyltransferase n=1 Tax=Propionibacterium cyclohexanicum TaxID=64702 RepID=A0A1H9RIP6_9ACTN|nr:cobalamin-independent methionine synthase II family protein [Propionibacterium cyclohexanicum]SER72498.1 5-methyltetrahydropteroyltriglutamate--homocysteine methyltransferase [Propionibacterium cyclohexanicum]